MNQPRTKDNIRFEEPLTEVLTLRITTKEMSQIITVSKDNYISTSELVRNLIRENISKYAISKNLIKTLHISNEIDRILLEKRLISSRNETNLSKIREILTDFEDFLDKPSKKIDYDELKNRKTQIDELLKLIYNEDTFLSSLIDTQVRRLLKNKHLKNSDKLMLM